MRVEVIPAFNYARDAHEMRIIPHDSINNANPDQPKQSKVIWDSPNLSLDLRYVVCSTTDGLAPPTLDYGVLDLRERGMLGLGVYSEFTLSEGQSVTFIMRTPPKDGNGRAPPPIAKPTESQARFTGLPLEGTNLRP